MRHALLVAYLALAVAIAALICCRTHDHGPGPRGTGPLPQTPFTYFKFTNKNKKPVHRVGYFRCNDGNCTGGEDRTPYVAPQVTPETPLLESQYCHDPCSEPTTLAVRLSVQSEDDTNGVNERVFVAPAGNTIKSMTFDLRSYDPATDRYTVFVRKVYYDANGDVLAPVTGTEQL